MTGPDRASPLARPASAGRLDVDLRRVLVVGLGSSGQAAVTALRGAGVAVTVAEERRDHPAADDLRAGDVEVHLGGSPTDLVRLLDRVDLVVPSPGVPEGAPVLREAAARGLPIWSEPELGWRLHPRPLLAVTGTNGKTSTTELLAAMLAADGRDARACGNIGTPFTQAAAEAADGTVLVAELSSFQLRFAGTLRPQVGLLLNLADDHLDWHGDRDAYGRAKARLWEAQGDGDWAVANAADPVTLALRDRHAPAGHAAFSGTGPVATGVGTVGDDLVAATPQHDGPLLPVADLAVAAPHHVANTAAAAAAALLHGVPAAAVADAARRYRPGRHRVELVAEVAGVRYVDDSKATNVHAAAAALRSAPSIVWIAGGLAKGVDLRALRADLGAVHDAVLIGTAADELAEVCGEADVPAHQAASIEEAVQRAARLARPGDTVLLAPACASFDQFRDYAERGERFAAAARALEEG